MNTIVDKEYLDEKDLEHKVKAMYREVAQNPDGEFHFEMGRVMAERLGYQSKDLDLIPEASIKSFAGVGYHFDLAKLKEGETVLDLGSGSGMDTFVAALKVGKRGQVIGVDMTDEQREKAGQLRDQSNIGNIRYLKGYIEDIPTIESSVDVVVSNGVINLSSDKPKVFEEICRILKLGGRMAISDIVTEIQMPDGITCNATLWAACIGGASQIDTYQSMLTDAGLDVIEICENPEYQFISSSAKGASEIYGVKSISLLAIKRV